MISFDHVTKRYEDNVGLDDVSINIDTGEFVFIVGPSGAGKSTFIKLILKEIDADEGSIIVNGNEVTTLSNRMIPSHRRNIGIVFQDFRLLANKTVLKMWHLLWKSHIRRRVQSNGRSRLCSDL